MRFTNGPRLVNNSLTVIYVSGELFADLVEKWAEESALIRDELSEMEDDAELDKLEKNVKAKPKIIILKLDLTLSIIMYNYEL